MYLTIDLGATKTLLALFEPDGQLIKHSRIPTEPDLKKYLNNLYKHLKPYTKYKIKNIVFAVAGIVQHGRPYLITRLHWNNPPLDFPVKKLFTCPIYFINDANAATLYESQFYSGYTMYLTFSTGLGGGLALDGKLLLEDSDDFEPGQDYVTFKDKRIYWTNIASAQSVGKFYDSRVTKIFNPKILRDISLRLASGLAPLISKYRPDTIIFGGALGSILNRYRIFLIRDLKRLIAISKETSPNKVKLPRLVRAKKPLRSTTFGALLYAKQHDDEYAE